MIFHSNLPPVVLDFESYSEAGYVWNGRWKPLQPTKPGLKGVGAWVYAEHPSTEILCLSYGLPGAEPALWVPGMPPPTWLAARWLVAANAEFEYAIWCCVCEGRMGWPPVNAAQFIDTAALCAAQGGPRSLEKAGEEFL